MEGKEVLVKVEGLSKKFCKDLKTSLKYGIQDIFSNLGGNKAERKLRDKEFWAVKDVSFELRRGECLGLIGHNGAGKSTLLKILNGLIKPDAGKVTIKGRVGALIELGAGFNPILTGRENIYNNGAILGFSKREISEKVEEIIDFAELREFIDMPVQNYSSGMKVRLGFAIAAQMEPDVLIIDEVLAVGDLGFILKCFKVIDNILPRTAVIFVSHSMPMISRMCNYIILLEKGSSSYMGNDVGNGIDLYYSKFKSNRKENIILSDGHIKLLEYQLIGIKQYFDEIPQLNWGDDLIMKFKFQFEKKYSDLIFIIVIYDKEQREVAYLKENDQNFELFQDDIVDFIIKHQFLQLSKGFYTIDISVNDRESREPYYRVREVFNFHVKHKTEIFPSFLLSSEFKKE